GGSSAQCSRRLDPGALGGPAHGEAHPRSALGAVLGKGAPPRRLGGPPHQPQAETEAVARLPSLEGVKGALPITGEPGPGVLDGEAHDAIRHVAPEWGDAPS